MNDQRLPIPNSVSTTVRDILKLQETYLESLDQSIQNFKVSLDESLDKFMQNLTNLGEFTNVREKKGYTIF